MRWPLLLLGAAVLAWGVLLEGIGRWYGDRVAMRAFWISLAAVAVAAVIGRLW